MDTVLVRPYRILKSIKKDVTDTKEDITMSYQAFFITNAGAQPLYIAAEEDATTDSFCIAANTTVQVPFTCEKLSIISNATGTTASIMIVE
jgi:hypothetical protein